jgi:hypothetical protein
MGLKKKSKEKVAPLPDVVLVSNTGSLEIIPARVEDDGMMTVEKRTVFTGVAPVVLSTDPRSLTTRRGIKWIIYLLLGSRIYLRIHYMRFGEAFTRDCHTNLYVDPEKKKVTLDKLGRAGENLKDAEILLAEAGEYIKSKVNRDFWRAARGRGVNDWLPWICCGVVAIAGFIALVVQNLMFIQAG